jgi:hypothetical protein
MMARQANAKIRARNIRLSIRGTGIKSEHNTAKDAEPLMEKVIFLSWH